MKESSFGADLRARTLSGVYPAMKDVRKPKVTPTFSSNVGGKEALHNDVASAIGAVRGKKGSWVTRLKDQSIEYREDKDGEDKRVAPAVQVGAGGEDSVKDKETNKNANVGPAMDWAERTASELKEAWWCGTPALEGRAERRSQERKHAGKVERSQFPDSPPKGLRFKGKPRPAPEVEKVPEKINNWVANANTLEAVIDEVNPNHPLQDPASRKQAAATIKNIRTSERTPSQRFQKISSKLLNKSWEPEFDDGSTYGNAAAHTLQKAAGRSHVAALKLKARGESIDIAGLENVIDEVAASKPKPKPSPKPAAKPAAKPASKPKAKPAKSDDQMIASKILKMAKTVSDSNSPHLKHMDYLHAAFAKATVHGLGEESIDESGAFRSSAITDTETRNYVAKNIKSVKGFMRKNPNVKSSLKNNDAANFFSASGDSRALYPGATVSQRAHYQTYTSAAEKLRSLSNKQKARGESIEKIVDGFLEDTMTGAIGTVALGFAPVGMLNPKNRPDVVNPGGKRKKRTNKYRKLAQITASMFGG